MKYLILFVILIPALSMADDKTYYIVTNVKDLPNILEHNNRKECETTAYRSAAGNLVVCEGCICQTLVERCEHLEKLVEESTKEKK